MSRIKIYCLEGCHGSGKTRIVDYLKSGGNIVLDENFIGMPSLGIPPQSFTMELIWICKWFERALELKKNNTFAGQTDNTSIYFADRSPYSAILYAEWGVLLKPIIQQNLIDLKRAGIDIVNIYVSVDSAVLWDRISARLLLEPGRNQYKENSRDHMSSVLEFYKSHEELWNYTVDNTSDNIDSAVSEIIRIARMDTYNYSGK